MSIVDARMQPLAVAHGCSPSRRRTSFDNNTYKAGNQITNSGYTYDSNGNLTNDGTSAYTWDRANRLLNVGAAGANVSKYDGLGNRVSRDTGGFVVNLLNDLQPGLAQTVVVGYPSLGTTSRQVQTPMGVLAQKDTSGAWEWSLADGLGSVRSVTNNSGAVMEHRHFEPYGNLYAGTMNETPFGFTGEWRDGGTGMYYLRARYYNPAFGAFVSRDPYAGTAARAMSLNGYSWVEGNPVMNTDPSGRLADPNAPVAANSDFDAVLQSSGLSLVPEQARDRFTSFQSYVSQRLGRVNTCPDDPNPYKLTYRDMLALFVGGEFGSLANSLVVGGVRVGLEAVARYYYYYAGADGQFDGTELWLLFGNVHSFYDQFDSEILYERMINGAYRILATEILSGTIDGQNVTTGQAGGRPWNWGNSALITERTRNRLQQANTESLNYSIYYRQVQPDESHYDYNVVYYYTASNSPSGDEFVLWTLSQEYCFRSNVDEQGAPLTGCAVYESRSARDNGEPFTVFSINNDLVE